MANVGVSYCQNTCFPLANDCQSLRLTISSGPADPGQRPVPRCYLPALWLAYADNGGPLDGVTLTFDPGTQTFQPDPAAGYPAATVWCDDGAGNGVSGTLIRMTNQDGTWVDVYPQWQSTGPDGSMVFTSPQAGGCLFTWKFKCVNNQT